MRTLKLNSLKIRLGAKTGCGIRMKRILQEDSNIFIAKHLRLAVDPLLLVPNVAARFGSDYLLD